MARWWTLSGAAVLVCVVALALYARYAEQSAERAAIIAESKARMASLSTGTKTPATLVPPSVHDGADLPKRSERETDLEQFAALRPVERISTMKKLCPPGSCERARVWRIVTAGETDVEKKQLNALAEKLVAADQEADSRAEALRGRSARAKAAQAFDAVLLARGLNPDGVEAIGPNHTKLLVRGWFCSRQFIYNFQQNSGEEARKAGFESIECRSSTDTWEAEL